MIKHCVAFLFDGEIQFLTSHTGSQATVVSQSSGMPALAHTTADPEPETMMPMVGAGDGYTPAAFVFENDRASLGSDHDQDHPSATR